MAKHKAQQKANQQKKQLKNVIILMVVGGLLIVVAILISNNTRAVQTDPELVKVSGQPSLSVDQELIDYGDVKVNTQLSFDLQITNVGDQMLRLTETPYIEVKEGC